jgi:arylsulfatase A-like enzyme
MMGPLSSWPFHLALFAFVACGKSGAQPSPRAGSATSTGPTDASNVHDTASTETGPMGVRPPGQPNIIFIFSDDHAEQAISAYGSRVNVTPHIDRLAKEGARFVNSFVTNSLCTPSRAAILTGKHSHLNGVRILSDSLDPASVTFPRLMHDGGYQTALFGKWHLKTNPVGFDRWEIFPDQGEYYNPLFLSATGNATLTGYVTDIITDKVLSWLRTGRDSQRPFLVMMHHKAPHRGWQPGPQELQMFNGLVSPVPGNFFDDYTNRASAASLQKMEVGRDMELGGDLKVWTAAERMRTPALFTSIVGRLNPRQRQLWDAAYNPRIREFQQQNLQGRALALWKYQQYIQDYTRCIAGVDKSVGQVLDYLDQSGLRDNTIVIYGSDQGFYLGEHGWFDKRWMYEESLRTPFIVRWPGVAQAGGKIEQMVQNLDYAPTFLDLGRVKIPPDMQGDSLVPLLLGQQPPNWRKSIYYQFFDTADHNVPPHYGVRTETMKLIHYPVTSEWELFDLQKDPQEMKSVLAEATYHRQLAALQAELARLRQLYQVPEGQ